MKVLVTGGAGFIGSHLVSFLLARGHRVKVVDNLSSGSYTSIEQHEDNANFEFHELDISDNHGALDGVFQDVEWVFHLAALADIVPSIGHPVRYHKANVDGTVNVLEASRKSGIKKLIYTASSTCYGTPDQYPTPETAPINPGYPYALTKNIGEQYVLHWNKLYHIPVVCLRLFNVYGTRAKSSGTYGAVFGVFLAQKLAGTPFTVVGDGTQTRDFTFVSDVVDGLYRAAYLEVSGETINLGSGSTYSINSLVELLGGEVTYVPKRPGEPECTFADITRARELLGYEPKVSFEDGVQLMLDNIDYWKQAPIWTPDLIEEATEDWFRYLSDMGLGEKHG